MCGRWFAGGEKRAAAKGERRCKELAVWVLADLASNSTEGKHETKEIWDE